MEGDRNIWKQQGEVAFFANDAWIVTRAKRSAAARQLAARRAKLMKELRELIAEVERRVALFNSGRAALWTQAEAAFDARMLAKWNL